MPVFPLCTQLEESICRQLAPVVPHTPPVTHFRGCSRGLPEKSFPKHWETQKSCGQHHATNAVILLKLKGRRRTKHEQNPHLLSRLKPPLRPVFLRGDRKPPAPALRRATAQRPQLPSERRSPAPGNAPPRARSSRLPALSPSPLGAAPARCARPAAVPGHVGRR